MLRSFWKNINNNDKDTEREKQIRKMSTREMQTQKRGKENPKIFSA